MQINKVTRIVLIVLTIFYFYVLFYFLKPLELLSEKHMFDVALGMAAIITLIGLIMSGIGILLKNARAKKLFIFYNFVYLLFGLYLAYFHWSFWLFKTPTLMDRVRSATVPLLLGVILPVALILYFLRNKKDA